MRITKQNISDFNQNLLSTHQQELDFLAGLLSKEGISPSAVINNIKEFQIADQGLFASIETSPVAVSKNAP